MNRPLLISLAVNVVLFLLLGTSIYFGVKASHADCPPESVRTVVTYRDSIVYVRDTTLRTILSGKPKLVRHVQYAFPLDTFIRTSVSDCADSNFYCQDTLELNNYRASATAIVSGNQLLSWSVKYVNLRPDTIQIKTIDNTIIEHAKSPVFKVYGGVFGQVRQSYWGIGAKADIVIADAYMIGYGFDVKNLSHEVEFLMKIRLKK